MRQEFPMSESDVIEEIRRQIESVGGSVGMQGLPLDEKIYETMVRLFRERKAPIRQVDVLREIGVFNGQGPTDAYRSLEAQGRILRVPGGRTAGWVPKLV